MQLTKGNVFEHLDLDYICITTNSILNKNGELVMGAGVALEAKQRFPELPKVYGSKIKKMGLVGEFKFFSEFGWSETGATDWKQTKAGNRSHQPNLFQTDSHRFSNHFKKEKTTRVPKNPNRLYSLFLNHSAQ